jgi:hypothetical protein
MFSRCFSKFIVKAKEFRLQDPNLPESPQHSTRVVVHEYEFIVWKPQTFGFMAVSLFWAFK